MTNLFWVNVELKTCISCQRELVLTEFALNSKMACGRVNICKQCKWKQVQAKQEKGLDISILLKQWKRVDPERRDE